MIKKQLFILSPNDLETLEILNILKKLKKERNDIDYIVTHQAVPTWEGLEEHIKKLIINKSGLRQYMVVSYNGNKELDENIDYGEFIYNKDTKYQSYKKGKYNILGVNLEEVEYDAIYGIELQGEPLKDCINIDYHNYDNDERYNTLTSLEQLAKILNFNLSFEQKLICANSKGYIFGMKELCKKYSLSDEIIDFKIREIRRKDRTAQGITAEDYEKGKTANFEAKDDLLFIKMFGNKCATVTDRCNNYEYELKKGILIYCYSEENNEVFEINYYGPFEICSQLKNKFLSGKLSGNEKVGYFKLPLNKKDFNTQNQNMFTQLKNDIISIINNFNK
jgi:hypothetical protein